MCDLLCLASFLLALWTYCVYNKYFVYFLGFYLWMQVAEYQEKRNINICFVGIKKINGSTQLLFTALPKLVMPSKYCLCSSWIRSELFIRVPGSPIQVSNLSGWTLINTTHFRKIDMKSQFQAYLQLAYHCCPDTVLNISVCCL